jgi:hypothetical protein
MRFLPTAALALTSVIGASALPAKRQTSTNSSNSSNIDPDILQYALTVSSRPLRLTSADWLL